MQKSPTKKYLPTPLYKLAKHTPTTFFTTSNTTLYHTDLPTLTTTTTPNYTTSHINNIKITNNKILTSTNSGEVLLSSTKNPSQNLKFEYSDKIYESIQKDYLIISGSINGQIIFWDIRNNKNFLSIFYQTQSDDINCLDFCNNFLICGSEDFSLCLYDLNQFNEEESVELIVSAEQPLKSVKFFDETKIGFCCNNNSFGVFDLEKGVKGLENKYENSFDNKSCYFVKEAFFGDLSFFCYENGFLNFYGTEKNFKSNLKKTYFSEKFNKCDYIRDLAFFENCVVSVDDGNNINIWSEKKQDVKNKMGFMFSD